MKNNADIARPNSKPGENEFDLIYILRKLKPSAGFRLEKAFKILIADTAVFQDGDPEFIIYNGKVPSCIETKSINRNRYWYRIRTYGLSIKKISFCFQK